MCDGRLSRPACFPFSNLKPNLVAMATSIAHGRQRFADQLFVGEWSVHFGRIEERHAAVKCRPDDGEPVFTGRRGAVAEADAHAPETESRHFQSACSQPAFLHCMLLRRHASANSRSLARSTAPLGVREQVSAVRVPLPSPPESRRTVRDRQRRATGSALRQDRPWRPAPFHVGRPAIGRAPASAMRQSGCETRR